MIEFKRLLPFKQNLLQFYVMRLDSTFGASIHFLEESIYPHHVHTIETEVFFDFHIQQSLEAIDIPDGTNRKRFLIL
jgi:hypothetical protein